MPTAYYNTTFVSPEPLYALIKEELKSYFDTGAVDDILFGIWTERCLRMLAKGSLPIVQDVLHLENSSATLPTDFDSVREIWATTCISHGYQLPNALYRGVSRNISTDYDRCKDCDPCIPEIVHVTYKTTTDVTYSYQVCGMLKPANNNAMSHCGENCLNASMSWPEGNYPEGTFDVRGNKLITDFPTGDLYLVYYAKQYDNAGYQLIPEPVKIQNYIECFIKYKLFEMLSNQIVDETFKQIEYKCQQAKQAADEALITALNEQKKETTYRKIEKMKRISDRFRYYNIR